MYDKEKFEDQRKERDRALIMRVKADAEAKLERTVSQMTEKELSADMELLSSIISQICDYAVDNGLEPDDTIKTIAGNLKALCEISSFNNWRKEEEYDD